LTILRHRIIVRDERLLEYEVGKNLAKEMKMLRKMLDEQPTVPLTLMDMCKGLLKEVEVTSYPGVPLERSHHLTPTR
jgi:hypothetical protein